jgi:hypothetical protein
MTVMPCLAEHLNRKRSEAKSRWQAGLLNLICGFETISSGQLKNEPSRREGATS